MYSVGLDITKLQKCTPWLNVSCCRGKAKEGLLKDSMVADGGGDEADGKELGQHSSQGNESTSRRKDYAAALEVSE